MSGAWRIRPATRQDGDLLVALERVAFGTASWGDDGVRSGLTAPRVAGLLACDKAGEAMGFLLWRSLGREAEILTVGAAPAARRRGVASALLETLYIDAAAQGCSAMYLEVDETNEAARALYQKHGFEMVGQRRSYYRTGANALVLRRYL